MIQSTVHNPTGSVLDESGRQALASLDVPVLDDATLYDTLVDAPLAKPTAAYDAKWGNSVISPALFTKLVFEGT